MRQLKQQEKNLNLTRFIAFVLLQGLVFHYLGSHRLGEKTLRDAVPLDPMAEISWY